MPENIISGLYFLKELEERTIQAADICYSRRRG